jgi:hypothetical protein
VRHHLDHLPALADRDRGIEGKPAREFGAQARPGDRPPDHEGARRADVHGIQVFQLFGEQAGSKPPMAPDVDPSQQNHQGHG